MDIEIKELRKKDYKKAIQYAIKGMHLNVYFCNKLELNLYGRYFLYSELTNATQVISAYMGDELAGVLLVEMRGEEKIYKSFWRELYVKIFEWIEKIFFKDGSAIYNETNKEMLYSYKSRNTPDGKITFLAVNPDIKAKGIGTLLLNELEKREKGKEIYVFTDDQCTYQFYEHRGFNKVGEKDIELDLKKRKLPLKCLMYSKYITHKEEKYGRR